MNIICLNTSGIASNLLNMQLVLFMNISCSRMSRLKQSILVFVIVVFSLNHQISDVTGSLAKICGNRSREVFVSNSNVMYVHFHSDGSVNDYGFDAEYQEVEGRFNR